MADRRDSKNRVLEKGEYQKSDGRYMYRYTDSDGITRFVYSWTLTTADRPPKGKTSKKCLRALKKEIEKDLMDGINTYNSKTTLNDFYEEYIEEKRELKPSTRANYKYMYKKYVSEELGKRKLADIKYSDVKRFYNQLISEKGFKPNSMEIINTIVNPIFKVAVRDGYIRSNPVEGVMTEIKKSNAWEKTKRHALTEKEQEALVDYVANHRTYNKWAPIITIMLGTGCRIGEIIGLTWNDCDFDNDIISINHSLNYRPNEYTGKIEYKISTPKTKSGEREIPMFQSVKKVLLKIQEENGINKDVMVEGYSGFIFLNRFGKVIKPHNINNALSRIIRDYNIEETQNAENEGREALLLPHFSVHNLRHTFCTRMCENESNLKVIQEIMGHADIGTTMNIYNEATRDKKKESFRAIESKIKIC